MRLSFPTSPKTKDFVSFYIFFQSVIFAVNAQNGTEILIQPKIAVNINSSQTYALNFSISKRSFLYRGDLGYEAQHLQISRFSTYGLNSDNKISLGLMYRSLDVFDSQADNELRLTAQYNYKVQREIIRYGHRFRFENRFRKERFTIRFRYRYGIDFPIQGQRLDIGEHYGMLNAEMVSSVEKGLKTEYESRWTVGVGKRITPNTKLQFKIHYRKKLIGSPANSELFVLLEIHSNL
jgi:hypothetical protein